MTSTGSSTHTVDLAAEAPPLITNITDDSADSDYSTVTMHGTGQAGLTINVYDEHGTQVNIDESGNTIEVHVDGDGNWTFDISDLDATGNNDNEFFTATQIDAAGNESAPTAQTHYFHGDFEPALTEDSDDYVLLGLGDDHLVVDDDDVNDQMTADGGAGNDTAKFDFALTSSSISLNADGHVIIEESNGDVNTFIEFEEFDFTDGTYTKEELFDPTITIIDADDTLSLTELENKVQYTVGLPPAAVVGAILLLTINGIDESYLLTQTDIDNGSVTREVDGDTISGDDFEVTVQIQYSSGTSNVAEDTVEINTAPIATDDTLGLQGSYYGWEESVEGSNLDTVQEARDYINANNPDATFNAQTIEYGFGSGDLGTGDSLETFLGDDADSLNTSPGDTSDAILHLEGAIYLDAGEYQFRVTADDGYAIYINGVEVAIINGSQASATDTFDSFMIDSAGYHEIEIVYYDQGGAFEFIPELGLVSGATTSFSALNTYPLSSNKISTPEDTALTISKETLMDNDSDADSDSITITDVSVPAGAQWSVSIDSDGDVSFIPDDNFNGVATFTYTLTDEHGDTDTATVYVHVNSINDAPVVDTSVIKDAMEGGATIGDTISVTDVDSDTFTFEVLGDIPDGFSLNADGSWTFDPTDDAYNSLTDGDTLPLVVTIEITDDTGVSAQQEITINVSGTNDVPTAESFTTTLSGNTTSVIVDFASSISDPEDDRSDTDALVTNITQIEDTQFGTIVDTSSGRAITSTSSVASDTSLEYQLRNDIHDYLSFNAEDDFAPNYSNNQVTQFSLANGAIVSGGTFSGDRPDDDNELTPEGLFYDSKVNETGLGVGNSELDVTKKDYVSVAYGANVLINEANVNFGSVWGNYHANSTADAQINILVLRDGVVISELEFDDSESDYYDGSGELVAHIDVEGGFDEVRVYTVQGDDPDQKPGTNSNITFQGIDVLDVTITEEINYTAVDSDGSEVTATATIEVPSTKESFNSVTLDNEDPGYIYGDDQDNELLGGLVNDILVGNEGDDLLFGGTEDDILTGGTGQDTFVFESASLTAGDSDVITDFSISEGDKLDLSDLFSDIDENDPVANYLSISDDSDGNAVMTVEKGGDTFSVEFEGVSSSALTDYLYDPTNPGLIDK